MPERPVSIGNGSWLGHGTVVLPGATIGRHVVIGANSVVTGHIPDNSVAAGVPARVIKTHRMSASPSCVGAGQRTEPRGGAQLGISLSPANVSIRSVIGTSVDGGLGERTVLARAQHVGVPVAVVQERAIVGLPRRNDRLGPCRRSAGRP